MVTDGIQYLANIGYSADPLFYVGKKFNKNGIRYTQNHFYQKKKIMYCSEYRIESKKILFRIGFFIGQKLRFPCCMKFESANSDDEIHLQDMCKFSAI